MRPSLIIGIDPGLVHTGWGLVEIHGSRLCGVACGTISPPARGEMAARLSAIHESLAAIIKQHNPIEAAIEESFVGVSAKSALVLGMARGAALLAVGSAGLPAAEYAARTVKKSVTGTGTADKTQIAAMIARLLPQCKPASDHEADALAIAVCHAHHRSSPLFRLA